MDALLKTVYCALTECQEVDMSAGLGKIAGVIGFAYHRVLRLTRRGRWPLTMGVRIMVFGPDDSVLLVRHTYAAGWHFPGGAVDPRETLAEAALRELREEALMASSTEPVLFGVYFNLTENKSDHIALFVAKDWINVEGKTRPLEIAEAKFFPVRDLPQGTTGGTRRRLNEFFDGAAKSQRW